MATDTLLKLPAHVGQAVFDDASGMAVALAEGGAAGLAQLLAEDGPALAEVIPPAAPHARMSLGLSALADARQVLVQIQGPRKAEVIEAAAGGATQYPIAALL